MPPLYLNKIEDVVKLAAEESMLEAADDITETSTIHPHQFLIASTPHSALIAHGRHEDTTTTWALVLLSLPGLRKYLIMRLNRICEKFARWSSKRREEQPDEYQKWFDSHKANCRINHTRSSQWNRLLRN